MTDGHIVQPGKAEATENGGDSRAGAVAGLVILWPVWAGGGLCTTHPPHLCIHLKRGFQQSRPAEFSDLVGVCKACSAYVRFDHVGCLSHSGLDPDNFPTLTKQTTIAAIDPTC